MPLSKKSAKPRRRAPARRRRMGGRRRMPLKYNANRIGGPQTARVTQTIPTRNVIANQPYVISIGGIVGDRALAHAPEYALYRISKVVFRFKPNYDTYNTNLAGAPGGLAGPISVPTLYWKMNRFADAPAAFTSDDLRSLGAKPFRFDDKQLTVAYKPNILMSQATAGSVSGTVKMTPWLNTDTAPDTPNFAPSTTEHYGHFFIIECATAGAGNVPVGTFDATIYYEFKNPRVTWGSSSSAQSVVPLNLSSSDATIHVVNSPQEIVQPA